MRRLLEHGDKVGWDEIRFELPTCPQENEKKLKGEVATSFRQTRVRKKKSSSVPGGGSNIKRINALREIKILRQGTLTLSGYQSKVCSPAKLCRSLLTIGGG